MSTCTPTPISERTQHGKKQVFNCILMIRSGFKIKMEKGLTVQVSLNIFFVKTKKHDFINHRSDIRKSLI